MARRGKGKVGVRVAPVPIPRALVRAQIAGEVIKACGGNDGEVDVAQRGVQRGLLHRVVVYGVDAAGQARDEVALELDDDASGDVQLDLDGGRRSATEALDGGLARMVGYHADRMRRRGLKAEVFFQFSAAVRSDPERLAAARAELGIGPAEAPGWRPGHSGREVVTVRPEKDGGLLARFLQEFEDGGD
jgi:hypothetical protein